MKPFKERLESFKEDYLKLVEKHGVWVDGCSCCDGPWFDDVEMVERGVKMRGWYKNWPEDVMPCSVGRHNERERYLDQRPKGA